MYQLSEDTSRVIRLSDSASIPADPANRDWQAYQQWLAAGNTPEPSPGPDIQAAVTAAVQDRLDAFAKTRGYDGILSACTYATSKVAKFAAEGAYCVDARDAHWAQCYAIMADVQGGLRPMPTVDAVLAELPALEWPL